MSEKFEMELPCGETAVIDESDKSEGIGYICYHNCPDGEINGYTHRCDEFED